MPPDPGSIGWSEATVDAEALVSRYTLAELTASADEYFARMTSWDHLLAKPFGSIAEASTISSHLGALLSALELRPGLDVLDFGAGACWTSRILAQLGCRVIACDVAPSALEIGRRLFELYPIVGEDRSLPRLLPFDGLHIDLPSASVDRVACMDAFHHVSNRPEVLAELARVLRPGGRAVMAEAGPHHSLTPQSQAEMRSFKVVERDIVVADLAREAVEAGFEELLVGIYAGAPTLVPSATFDEELAHGAVAAEAARTFLDNHRLLVFRKAGTEELDSRCVTGLAADIRLEESDGRRLTLRVTNTGSVHWLTDGVGKVNVGGHFFAMNGELVDFDFLRSPVLSPDGPIRPGQSVEVLVEVPAVSVDGILEVDLVAEGVAWFGVLGGSTVRIEMRTRE